MNLGLDFFYATITPAPELYGDPSKLWSQLELFQYPIGLDILGPDLIWSQIRFWGPVGGVVLESLSLGWDVQFDSLIEILLEAHERSWKLIDPHGIL